MERVEGKIAMVTGGRRGLGKAIAILLAKEGAKVVITDRKDEGAGDILEEIKQGRGQGIFLLQDLRREDDW